MRISFFLIFAFLCQIVFAQESYQMYKIGQWDDPNLPSFFGLRYNDIWGWENPEDDRAYAIIGTSRSTLFIDVTDPANPVLSDSIAGEHTRCIHRDFKTYRHYAYGVADQGARSTLQVFDMSTLPDSVSLVYNSNEFFSRAHNIFIDENAGRLYVVGSNTQNGGIITLDLTETPEEPTLLSSLDLGSYTHDIFVRNDTAWMSNGNNGLVVYDYEDANNPVVLGRLESYPEQGYNHSSWLSADGKKLVMADETHGKAMKLVNTSDLQSMSVSSVFKSALLAPADEGSIPHNPFVTENYAVISYYHDGVQVFDISDPENVVNVAYYDTYPNHSDYGGFEGCWGVYPFFNSGMIIASDQSTGLYILHTDFVFPKPITAEAKNIIEPLCAGDENGSLDLDVSGGGNSYTYEWSNGDDMERVENLGAGNYYFTVTDQWGFEYTDSVLISEPDSLLIALFGEPSDCPDSENGRITVQVQGGTGDYNYSWTTGNSTDSISGLFPGSYGIEVSDENNCLVLDSIELSYVDSFPLASFNYEVIDMDDQCLVVFDNASRNYENLRWDLDIYGFTGMDIDTLAVDQSFTACLTVSNNCGESENCVDIEIECLTNSDENALNEIGLYPNPFIDEITLDFDGGLLPKEIKIYANDGKVVYQTNKVIEQLTIPMNYLSQGVYVVQCVFDQKVLTRRIIKS